MTDQVSLSVAESAAPSRARTGVRWLGLAILVLLVGVGIVWAFGGNGAPTSQPAATTHNEVDHASATTHSQSQSQAAEASMGDEHTDHKTMANMDDDHETMANMGDEHKGHDLAATAAHEAVAEHEHADTQTPAQAIEPPAHSHGHEAEPIAMQMKQVVLGGLAGINGLVIVAAAIFRRRNPPRLPKHLQSQTQGSKP
jgi:hypothetical protein